MLGQVVVGCVVFLEKIRYDGYFYVLNVQIFVFVEMIYLNEVVKKYMEIFVLNLI